MTAPKPSHRLFTAIVMGVAVLTFSGSAARAADQAQVQGRNLEVVSEMASDAARVELVRPGQTLEVLGKNGRWLQVRTPGGKTGYVPEAMVKRRGGGGSGFAQALSGLTGSPSASDLSAGNAAKGLTPDAEKYAQSRGYRTDAPDRLVALRNQAKPDLQKFKEQGNVGVKR